MGDRKDKELAMETLEKKEEDVGVALPVGDGRRVPRRVPKLPPSRSEGGGGSPVAGGERKRIRGRRQEAEDTPTDEEVTHDGDDVKVKKSVKVSSAAKASLVSGGVGVRVEDREEETGEGSLRHPQPLLVEKGHQSSQVGGGAIVKRGETSSSSVVTSGAGRSEEGSSEQSTEEDKAHPCLFIENILDVIFKHIIDRPVSTKKDVEKDVRSIRLVCKTWRDSATRVYRRNGPTITFQEYDGVGQLLGKPLTEFMDTMKSSQMIPVQKFRFWGRVFHHGDPKLFVDFLRICGPEVVSLGIGITRGDAERLTLNLKSQNWVMPKLATLKLRMPDHTPCKVRSNAESHGIVNLIELLLTAAKTLRMFRLFYPTVCNCRHESHTDDLLTQQLGQVIVSRIPRTVKELDLTMEMHESTFNNLAQRGLALRTFKFCISNSSFNFSLDSKTMYQFLKSQAASLNALQISNCSWNEEGVLVELPCLSELTRLEFDDVVISTTDPSDFADTLPKLNCLEASSVSTELALQSMISIVKKPSQSLKVLHLPKWNPAVSASLIKNVAQCFPNTAELHIVLHKETRETMEEVFKYFDNLESLNISFLEEIQQSDNWVDSIFSGIPEPDCIRMKILQDYENESMEQIHRQPSILNLTKLRKLVVGIDEAHRLVRFRLTDITAHFVFLEMANLCEIHLSNEAVQFSPRYLELLQDRLVLRDVDYVE